MRRCIAVIVLAAGFAVFAGASARASAAASAVSPLVEAQALYDDAQYGPALAVLDELAAVASTPDVHQYRALCLIALGRHDEAARAMDASVTADPHFRPDPRTVSPRVASMFTEARRRLLPATIRHGFAAAMALHREGARDQAGERFSDLLRLLEDPALKDEQSLADLALAASAFVELRRAQAVPPVLPSGRVSEVALLLALAPAMSVVAALAPDEPTASFTPPVALSQELPKWTPPNNAMATRTFVGAIAVVIDEQGRVVKATKQRTIHPAYDPAVLEAARGWTYMPAFRDGLPVRSELTVEVQFNPPVD